MTDSPPRKRFQFHLSTAVVMMFVAGALMWANFIPVKATQAELNYFPPNSKQFTISEYGYGWPIKFFQSRHWNDGAVDGVYWGAPNVLEDAIVALAILFATWFLCEYLIRRRAAQKGP